MFKIILDVYDLERTIIRLGYYSSSLTPSIVDYLMFCFSIEAEPLVPTQPMSNESIIPTYLLDDYFKAQDIVGSDLFQFINQQNQPNSDPVLINIHKGYLTIISGVRTDDDRFRGLLQST